MSERFKYRFERWCEKKGGVYAYDEYLKEASCVFSDFLDDEDVKDFINFVDANRYSLKKEKLDACIMYRFKLIGGYEEGEHVCYDSTYDEIAIRATYYSDYGTRGEVKEELPKIVKRRETIDSIRVVFEKERGAEFNDATDVWMGVGEVYTHFKFRVAKRNPELVVKVLDKARDEADYLANEALEYIKPIEEEEEEFW